MVNYRRCRLAGGTYFFTTNLLDRDSRLLVEHIDLLRETVRRVRRRRPFHIDAWVVLPDHLHAMWTLPEGDADYSGRWREIKKAFAKALPSVERLSAARMAKGERAVWQRRFWEHAIRDDADYAAHLDYVHFNPVKHGLVQRAVDWPYSTFHRAVAAGVYSLHWGASSSG